MADLPTPPIDMTSDKNRNKEEGRRAKQGKGISSHESEIFGQSSSILADICDVHVPTPITITLIAPMVR